MSYVGSIVSRRACSPATVNCANVLMYYDNWTIFTHVQNIPTVVMYSFLKPLTVIPGSKTGVAPVKMEVVRFD